MQVQSPKAQVIGLVEEMPDDSSYDEIVQELVFARMVSRGLNDVKAGRTISDEEMQRTIESWAAE